MPHITPRISVIMPAYNVAELLPRAVQSLQAQTMPDWDLHIVIDAATDTTQQVAESLAKTDPRIHVHPQQTNGGPSVARNIGFTKATGQWVALLDADDAYAPTRLEKLLAVAESGNLDMVSDNLVIYDLAARRSVGITWRSLTFRKPQPVSLETFLTRSNPLNRFTYGLLKPMFRREFLTKHKLAYDTRYRVGEDTLLHIHALRLGAREMIVGEPLYIYTLPRSVVGTTRSQFSQSSESNTANHIRTATEELLASGLPGLTPRLLSLLRRRLTAYARWEKSRKIMGHFQRRRFAAAGRELLADPAVFPLMMRLIARRVSFRVLSRLGLPIG